MFNVKLSGMLVVMAVGWRIELSAEASNAIPAHQRPWIEWQKRRHQQAARHTAIGSGCFCHGRSCDGEDGEECSLPVRCLHIATQPP